MKELYKMQADVCRIMANPVRMEIIYLLESGETIVGELVDSTGLTKSNVSQHLRVLKSNGIVSSRREGQNVFYAISTPKIIEACRLMREVLLEQLEERQKIIEKVKAG